MLVCPKCGGQIAKGAKFCMVCGQRVEQQPHYEQESHPQQGFDTSQPTLSRKEMKRRSVKIYGVLGKLERRPLPWTRRPEVREEVLNKIRETGQPILEEIFKLSSDSWPETRARAMRCLGGLGAVGALWLLEDERAEDLLIYAVENEEYGGVRFSAIDSLLLIEEAKKTGKAIPLLIDYLKGSTAIIKCHIATGFGLITWNQDVVRALIGALSDNEPLMRDYPFRPPTIVTFVGTIAADSLKKIGEPSIEPLVSARNDSDKDVREGALRVLKEMGWLPKDDVEKARYLIELPGFDPKRWAELSLMGKPAVEPLIEALKHEESSKRHMAVVTLGKIGDARAVNPLIRALNDSNLQDWVAKALIQIGGQAVEPLTETLKDDNPKIREKAVEILGKISDKRATMPLIQCLSDESPKVRKKVAKALGMIGDAKAIEPLTVAMGDQNRGVRGAAKSALKKIRKRK